MLMMMMIRMMMMTKYSIASIKGLGRHSAAGLSFEEALKSLTDAKLDSEKKEKVEKGFRNSLNQVSVVIILLNQPSSSTSLSSLN